MIFIDIIIDRRWKDMIFIDIIVDRRWYHIIILFKKSNCEKPYLFTEHQNKHSLLFKVCTACLLLFSTILAHKRQTDTKEKQFEQSQKKQIKGWQNITLNTWDIKWTQTNKTTQAISVSYVLVFLLMQMYVLSIVLISTCYL